MIRFISPAYQSYPILVPALVCQTSPRWTLSICHDGPDVNFLTALKPFASQQLEISTTPKRMGAWGHPIRRTLLNELVCDPNDLVIITNHDNYIMPNLVKEVETQMEDIIIWPCIHNYYQYKTLPGKVEYSLIDVSQIAVRAKIAKEVGWRSDLQDSDFLYVQECWRAANTYKFSNTPLCVHN